MTSVSQLVLRDLALAALRKQPCPITAREVADAVSRFWTGEIEHVHTVLRELEERGLAVRHPGVSSSPRGGRPPSRWAAVRATGAAPPPPHAPGRQAAAPAGSRR